MSFRHKLSTKMKNWDRLSYFFDKPKRLSKKKDYVFQENSEIEKDKKKDFNPYFSTRPSLPSFSLLSPILLGYGWEPQTRGAHWLLKFEQKIF